MKRTHVCNLEIRIEETSLWKARTVIKENIKKYQNIKIANNSNLRNWTWTCVVTDWFEKIMDVSNFVFHFQFDILCRSKSKFLIGNFTVVLIRNFFPDWEPKFLKQIGLHRHVSGNWWNWWKNKGALEIKYRNKVSSPEEFFPLSQNLLRKQKTNHIIVKPLLRF